MREIEFRGKDVNENWHYGILAVITDQSYPMAGSYISNKTGSPFAYQVTPSTVGQYTGLKDKNGKKIFEGDIVSNSEAINGKVHFDDASFYVSRKKWEAWSLLIDVFDKVEVIGNIYDNPELLEPSQ